ncbi:MAG: aminoglycoside phosphotransferase family protein [Clostridia bacterium]|nr:aminoglycoside phosphotransferase family protein [Clostridia bacterium]
MRQLLSLFQLEGTPIQCVPFGQGHINQTWLVVTNRPHLYILQRVNTGIFRDPEGLMRNQRLVVAHMRNKGLDSRHVLTAVPTWEGGDFCWVNPATRDGKDDPASDGRQFWRMYEYVTGGICLERAENAEDFRHSGEGFGAFQRLLADFPAERLTETIPRFHDTPVRFAALREALRADPMNRAAGVRRETDFLLAREDRAGILVRMQRAGELPLRVTHNDTKLNNVMLDEKTREPLCVLDLDTVMPGLAATDFGDAIRFGASTAAEDEPDTSRVGLDLSYYRAFAEGFLSACGAHLSPAELETLPEGAWCMTMESAVRFLTDYLQGDVYFHTERPGQNLDRTRTQIALAEAMERREKEIRGMLAGG